MHFLQKISKPRRGADAALEDVKKMMTRYLGNSDTLNYKQDLLHKTLKAIAALEISRLQLSLF